MRSTSKSKSLTGSALLKFNPQALWRKAFRDAPQAADLLQLQRPEDSALPNTNRLIHSNAMYLSEPDEVRQCLETILPKQVFNLVLTNKIS